MGMRRRIIIFAKFPVVLNVRVGYICTRLAITWNKLSRKLLFNKLAESIKAFITYGLAIVVVQHRNEY